MRGLPTNSMKIEPPWNLIVLSQSGCKQVIYALLGINDIILAITLSSLLRELDGLSHF